MTPTLHYNLGAALASEVKLDEAIRHYQEALRLKPDRAEAHNNLGTAFYQQGRTGEAIRQFQEALRLKPDYAEARKNLVVALAPKGHDSPLPGAATNRESIWQSSYAPNSESSPTSPRPRSLVQSMAQRDSRSWLMAVMLVLVTIAIYWPATRCGFVNYDDDLHVTANLQVQKGLTWESVKWASFNPVNSNWHPVTVWSHMVDCQLFGLNPWGHHLTSVLLHALNAGWSSLLLRLMTGATWRSLLVAALFAFIRCASNRSPGCRNARTCSAASSACSR